MTDKALMNSSAEPEDEDYEYEDEEAQIEEPKKLDAQGLPETGPYASVNPAFLYPVMMIVFQLIGYAIAWGIYSHRSEHYDGRVAVLRAHELGCLYLAVLIIGQVLPIQQIFVAYHRKMAKVENPDQYVFKTMLKTEPYVRLESEGPVGAFNKAQRGIDNTRETFANMVVNLVFGGYVFPEAALAMSILFLVGRTAYSAGYISSSRMTGGVLSMLATTTTGGLVLFTTVQIFRTV